MDKLTSQTVYVPVDGKHTLLMPWDNLQELPNVYILTAEELRELVDNAMNEAIVELPKSRVAWNRCVNDFLKQKGVII